MTSEPKQTKQRHPHDRHPVPEAPQPSVHTDEPESQLDLKRSDVDLSGPGVYPPPSERPKAPTP